MSVKIRLMRIGSRGRPFYRVVAVDERKKRTGGYLELLGTYNPLTSPKEVLLKQDRIDAWVKNGAVMSEGFLRIIGKAVQHPIRPAKKAKAEPKPAEAQKEESSVEPEKESVSEESSESANESEETVKSVEESVTEDQPAEKPIIEATEETKSL